MADPVTEAGGDYDIPGGETLSEQALPAEGPRTVNETATEAGPAEGARGEAQAEAVESRPPGGEADAGETGPVEVEAEAVASGPVEAEAVASGPAKGEAVDPTPPGAGPFAGPGADEGPTYPPDPAGTRPKVSSTAILGGADAGRPRAVAGPLGQTFRPPPGPATTPPASSVAPAVARPALEPAVESPHAPRFQFILGALIALGLSALAITAYTLSSGRNRLPTDWSAWHPTASGIAAANQIANHVAAEYRLPDAAQLLAVKGGPLVYAGAPVSIAIKTGNAAADVSVLPGNAVLYKMCGLGPGCTIIGKASAERLMLVRREALELALYTFQYIGADQVVVLLPPLLRPTPVAGKKVKITTDPSNAVFFRSSDLSGELDHPLDATLTRQAPSVGTVDKAPDTAAVSALTSPSFYKFSFVQASQDNSLFLLLEPSTLGN